MCCESYGGKPNFKKQKKKWKGQGLFAISLSCLSLNGNIIYHDDDKITLNQDEWVYYYLVIILKKCRVYFKRTCKISILTV